MRDIISTITWRHENTISIPNASIIVFYDPKATMKKRYFSEPMKCHCGKVALYRVYKFGFCREHYDDGVKQAAKQASERKAFAIARGFKKA